LKSRSSFEIVFVELELQKEKFLKNNTQLLKFIYFYLSYNKHFALNCKNKTKFREKKIKSKDKCKIKKIIIC